MQKIKTFSLRRIDKPRRIRYPISCVIDYYAALAQLVERSHGKAEVDGSSPSSGL